MAERDYDHEVTMEEQVERELEGKRAVGTMVRAAPRDELAEFRGPDGVLGTDADYVEEILDARAAAAEAVFEE